MRITNFVHTILPKDSPYFDIFMKYKDEKAHTYTTDNCKMTINFLKDLKTQIGKGIIIVGKVNDDKLSATEILSLLFQRFHKVVRQLRTRHDGRNTLEINDEYDVQDLLHSLLQIYFDDIRKEEWTPSYAGGSSRVDFILPNEKLVVEVKKTRKSMNDKILGEELIIDIEKYKKHPMCEKLLCFVYDPEGILGNPQGIMNDLNKTHVNFAQIIIKPN